MNEPLSTTRRRWFQFRLRTLLLGILVFSIALAVTMHRWRVWQTEQRAYRNIMSSLGSFVFSCEEQQSADTVLIWESPDPTAPSWQRFCFGEFTGTTRVELTLPLLAFNSVEVKRDENGEYVHERNITQYSAPLEDPETFQNIVALDRLDVIILQDGSGFFTPKDIVQAQLVSEKAQEIRRRFPNCKVIYNP